MIWPPLPKRLHGTGGPIKVKLVKRSQDEDGDDAWGTWEPSTRTIEIERGAPLEHQYRTLYHEWMHSVLADAGIVNMLSGEAQEMLCDAVGAARVQEMRKR